MRFRPTIDDMAKALGITTKPKQTEFHVWGVARSSSTGGTVQVALNFGDNATCAVPKNLSVAAGDRVLVLVMRSGNSVVVNTY